jgi:uncharacterized protein (TIGR02246 family)
MENPINGSLRREASMSDDDNAQVARMMMSAWNARDLKRYVALLSDDCVVQSFHEAPAQGRDAAAKTIQRYLSASPDLWFDVTHVVTTEDIAVVSWQALGNEWSDTSVAGIARRPVRVQGCTVVGFRQGRVVRLWHYDEPLRLVTEQTSGVALAATE